MEMNFALTFITGIITWMTTQRWVWPLIIKLFNWIKNKKKEREEATIEAGQEIANFKRSHIEVQEKQFQSLLNQISNLENQLTDYATELSELRQKILLLNKEIFRKELVIQDLHKHSCCVKNCPNRILCSFNELKTGNDEPLA